MSLRLRLLPNWRPEALTQCEKCGLLVNMHHMVLLFTLLSLIIFPVSAFADGSLVAEGRGLAEANCARCHNLEKIGDSPFVPAPPFRIISKNYKPTDLEEAFVEGIVVGHPAMPEFELTGEQAAALAAFIDSLGR
jgi:cytochrome c